MMVTISSNQIYENFSQHKCYGAARLKLYLVSYLFTGKCKRLVKEEYDVKISQHHCGKTDNYKDSYTEHPDEKIKERCYIFLSFD